MKAKRTAWVAVFAVGCSLSAVAGAQERQADLTKPTVDLVMSVGCAEMKSGNAPTWWLTRASEAKVTQAPFTSTKELEEAKSAALAGNTYQLLGFAEFLDANGLLATGQRSEFTARESVNATGQLSNGAKVAVKGLFVQAGNARRINLTSVIKIADSCR